MRDPKRINPILSDIERIWTKTPDLRLCQILNILAKTYGDYKQTDLFYFEDSDLERAIEKYKRMQGVK
jgi:uncharacterized protein YihD (DUF1040 family)